MGGASHFFALGIWILLSGHKGTCRLEVDVYKMS
jgi:hypothetical protein